MLCDRLHAWWLSQSRLTTLLPSFVECLWAKAKTLSIKLVGARCSVFGRAHWASSIRFLLLQRFSVGLIVEYSVLNLDLPV